MSKDSNIECEKIDKNPLNFWRYRIILCKFLLFPFFCRKAAKPPEYAGNDGRQEENGN